MLPIARYHHSQTSAGTALGGLVLLESGMSLGPGTMLDQLNESIGALRDFE